MNRRFLLASAPAIILAREAFAQPVGMPPTGAGVAAPTTWNPADKSATVTLSGGNLVATSNGSANCDGVRGTNAHSSGKWYFEITAVVINGANLDFMYIGVADATASLALRTGLVNALGAVYRSNPSNSIGTLCANSDSTSISATAYTSGAVISVAVDVSNQLIYWAYNGTWQNSAVPASGTGGVGYITTAPVYPLFQDYSQSSGDGMVATLNCGATAFSYTVPSGFTAWG